MSKVFVTDEPGIVKTVDVTDAAVERGATALYPWAFPPDSDREDVRRREQWKKPRCGGDWEPTREKARATVRRVLEAALND